MPHPISSAAAERLALVSLPTPFEPLDRLSRQLGGPRIWAKRDDCTTLGGGGNKSRKLEYLMADALRCNADTVITAGAIQSNHCRQTAAAAARLGMNCILVLTDSVAGRTKAYHEGGNALLSLLFGAEIRNYPNGTDSAVEMNGIADEVRKRGGTPYIVPVGGSNALGAASYAYAVREIQAQAEVESAAIDSIVVATGSGGTQAGLLAGTIAEAPAISVHGVSVSKTAADLHPRLTALTTETLREIGSTLTLISGDVKVDDRFTGAGYGQPTREMQEAVTLVARTEGILLDPVYSGKAMAGLIQLLREGAVGTNGDVVFWHTGGSVGLFAYDDVFNLAALEGACGDGKRGL